MHPILRAKNAFNHLGIFGQFVTIGVFISIGMGNYLTGLIGPTLTQFTLGQQQLSFITFASRAAANLLEPIDFVYPPKVESTKRLAEFANRLQAPGLFRIKIWNASGTIVYSDKYELIGRTFPPTEGFEKAMKLQAEIGIATFDPQNNYYVYEVAFREGIEAFTPIVLGPERRVVGVVETYTQTEFLTEEIRKAQFNLTLRIALSLLVMFAALSYVVRRAARTLDDQDRTLNRYAAGLELLVRERTTELDRKIGELAVAKAKDDSLLESIGDGVMATDRDGAIIYANGQTELLLGWKLGEMRGKRFHDAVPVVDENGNPIPAEKHPVDLALTAKSRIKFSVTGLPVRFVRKDGDAFPVALTVTPIVVRKELQGAVMIFRDVTQEKEIDRAKTEFVSLASHQLRTPLTIINWYAEMLTKGDAGKLKPSQQRYLDEIYQGSKRLGALINSFLNVSRLELGTFIVEPKPVNVADLAHDVLKELTFSSRMKQLKIVERYAKGLPAIPADPKLARIIVQNVLTNAVKYTPPKGTVTVSVEAVEQGAIAGGRPAYTPGILVTVKDSGIGIPAKDQRKIFSKLFRADNAVEKETDGTGLGLYIIRSILDRVGGTIWFESPASPGQGGEENQGTAFYVLLPQEGMKRKEGVKTLA